MVSSLTRLDLTNKENLLFFVCSEATESKLVKLETSHTVILAPMVNDHCLNLTTSKVHFKKLLVN